VLQAGMSRVRFPVVSLEFFVDTMALRLTQPLTEMSKKVKVPRNRPEGPEGGIGRALLFPDHGARRGGWSAPRPGRFTPEKDPVPIVQ
jgi:hypothetical protein